MSGDERGPGDGSTGDGLDWSHLKSPLEGLPPLPGRDAGTGDVTRETVVPPPPEPEPRPEPPTPEPQPEPPAAAHEPQLPPYARGLAGTGAPATPWTPPQAAPSPPYAVPPQFQGGSPGAVTPAGYPGLQLAYAGGRPPAPPRPGRTIAVTALVLALVAALIGFIPLIGFLGVPVAIAAGIVAIVALARRAEGRGMSIGALVVSVLAFLLPWIMSFVYVLLLAGSSFVSDGPSTGEEPGDPYGDEVETVEPAWYATGADLRPGIEGAELRSQLDGTMEDAQLIDAGTVWAVVTADVDDDFNATRHMLHGLDPQTGEERWARESDVVRCALQPLEGAIACAEASLDADGVPTDFRLVTVDPASGSTIAETSVDAFVSALAVSGSTIVAVDEPIDAQAVRLLAFDAQLAPRWSVDLSAEANQRLMFSDGTIGWRQEPWRESPGLDRTRIRHVGPDGGIFALWAGQATAFVDVASGQLIGMPRCSRLVDDGARLWCNEGEHAAIYSYALDRLGQTPDGHRLMFPKLAMYRDSDVSPALTSSDDGVISRPDPQTGEVGDPLIDMGLGDAFGMPIDPSVYISQRRTYLTGEAGLALLSEDASVVEWTAEGIDPGYAPFVIEDRLYAPEVLLEDSFANVVSLDPADGTVTGEFETPFEAGELQLTPRGDVVGQRWHEAVGRYDDLP